MSYPKLHLIGPVTISMNTNLYQGGSFYTALNVKELLSSLGTRRSDTPKQAAHGVEGGPSHYGPRIMPFEGEIHAQTVSQRVSMEQNLRRCLSLPRAQDSDNDGFILVKIEDEDGNDKQIYAKVVEMPEFSLLKQGMSNRSRFRFVLIAEDPFLYDQTLSEADGPEAVTTTLFTLKEGSLKSLKEGSLPALKESLAYGLTVNNGGTIGTPPLIVIHGPTADPVITNQTTGKTMDLTGLTLLDNERVEIDVASQSITKFDSSDDESDASAYLSIDSDWIFIEPGNNTLSLEDSSPTDLEATIEVSFRRSWI